LINIFQYTHYRVTERLEINIYPRSEGQLLICKSLQATVGVMNNANFGHLHQARAQDKTPKNILSNSTATIPEHEGFLGSAAEHFGQLQTRIHACNYGRSSRGGIAVHALPRKLET